MNRLSALLALLLVPCAAFAAPRATDSANETAHDIAQRSDREIETLWETLYRNLDSLKNAQHTADVTAVLSLARSSTNNLARITNNIEVFQDRLLTVMSNEIDRQPLERTVKQELHGYVENDLQSLESVKSIACEDLDAIGSLISRHQTEWTAMIDVLSHMYPDAECMQIMQKRFADATDDLRSKIESHRSIAATEEPSPSPAPTPSAPAPSTPIPTPAVSQIPPPDPQTILARAERETPAQAAPAPDSQDDFGAEVGLSLPARQIGTLVRMGYADHELLPRIRHAGPFNLTGDQIIYLKASGISENLVKAMLKRDRSLHN